MHIRLSAFAWLAAGILLQACKTGSPQTEAPQPSEAVLFRIDDTPVTAREFLYVYQKNNAIRDTSLSRQEDMRNYLDLYINFKLKVQEAKDAGLHEKKAFLEELAGYKKQLARPYLTEQSVLDSLVVQAYDRLQTEINASHILIGLPPEASPADTLKAYQKVQEIRQKALSGADFSSLARQYSDDPSARENGGQLGYFTALQMVYPFENAAFSTPAGEISQPVRTRFGYHLLKVNDRRPAQGSIQVAHLLLRADERSGIQTQDNVKAKAYELYSRLQEGEDWDSLVKQYSGDRATRDQGGVLPPFSTGNMIPAFEEAAFRLQEAGQISEPVQTPYGWHIIRLVERIPLPSFEEIKAELQSRVARDSRAQLSEKALLSRLEQENEVKEFSRPLENLQKQADLSLLTGNIQRLADSSLLQQPLLQIAGQTYPVRNFTDWLQRQPKPAANVQAAAELEQRYQAWKKSRLLAFEEANLENKYEDYRMLVQEYHDGILLFQLMEEKVWAKAMADTAGLKAFFEANRDKYQWKERFEGAVFVASSQEIANQLKQKLQDSIFQLARYALDTESLQGKALSGSTQQQLQQFFNHLRTDEQSYLLARLKPSAQKAVQPLITSLAEKHEIAKERIRFSPSATADNSLLLLSQSPEVLETQFNAKNPLALQVFPGPVERGEQALTETIPWKPGLYTVLEDGRHYIIKIERVLPPAPKELHEVRGQLISDYQKKLEEEWVNSLRERYMVELNEDVFQQILDKS